LITLLYPWMRLSYDERGGCDSLFNVPACDGHRFRHVCIC
jgi:hypothetical protein